jgi:uncharacterized protein YndB with AHSA1/START domain
MSSRTIDLALDIDAPPTVVWEALTENDQLKRWLVAAEVRAEKGTGGKRWISWGPGCEAVETIEAWSPPRRMVLVTPVQDATRARLRAEGLPDTTDLRVEWTLEDRGQRTRVRVVQEGFGVSPVWDQDFEGTRTGWHVTLRNLRHVTTWYRNRPVRGLLHFLLSPLPVTDTWQRILGPRGVAAKGSLYGLREGDPFEVETSSGESLRGLVEDMVADRVFIARLQSHDNALWGFTLMPLKENTMLGWGMLTADASEEAGQETQRHWSLFLDRLFTLTASASV